MTPKINCSSKSALQYSYFRWMIDEKVKLYDGWSSYFSLCMVLHRIYYWWDIWQDDSRVGDAAELRKEFCALADDPNVALEWMPYEVSVLEVLVALACRLERDNMMDDRYCDRTPLWFWAALKNAGLLKYDDYTMTKAESENEVIMKVFDILEHRYDANGDGSFYPVKADGKDARTMTLWAQANNWIVENKEIIEQNSELLTKVLSEGTKKNLWVDMDALMVS